MANDLNQCTFTGRLGRDPETRAFPSGDEVTNLRLAVGSKWRDKQTGEVKERTEWISVICAGGLSKVASQYLRKGDQVLISGELRNREWEQDGQKRYATEIRADKLLMLGSRQGQGGQGQGDQGGYGGQQQGQYQQPTHGQQQYQQQRGQQQYQQQRGQQQYQQQRGQQQAPQQGYSQQQRQAQPQGQQSYQQQAPQQRPASGFDDLEDSIPF